MSIDLEAALQNKAINGWRLFWLISIPMCIVMVIAMTGADMSTGPGVSTMIGFSVRWAVPFIFLAVATSSLQVLFPGPFPTWLLRNRKYIGMCFAVAMAWQGLFIFVMSIFFRDYYYEDIYLLRDELEGSVGYIFLAAMVLTSFHFGFSVYWWNLSYYENPQAIDYVFYWSGFLAFVLRIAAWGKKRQQAAKENTPESSTPPVFKLLGSAIIAFGFFVSATGLHWQEPVTEFLLAPAWSANLVLWLPYWPFEPYLSIFIIGLGTMLLTKVRAR